jgi:hypothetical protein
MSSGRKLVTAIAALVLLGGALVWFFRPAPPPVKISFVRFQDEGTNGPVAIVHFTNYSTRSFHWDLRTFTLDDGVWLLAARQPDFEYPATLRGRGSRDQAVPVPDGPNKWMVEFSCWRTGSRWKGMIERAFGVARLGSPFRDSRQQDVVMVLDFEK